VLTKNLDTFGRRPLGFCDRSITIENPLSNRELKLLKEKKKLREQSKPAKKRRNAAPATNATKKKKRKKPAPLTAVATSGRACVLAPCRGG
jgi:hypothetical protein